MNNQILLLGVSRYLIATYNYMVDVMIKMKNANICNDTNQFSPVYDNGEDIQTVS